MWQFLREIEERLDLPQPEPEMSDYPLLDVAYQTGEVDDGEPELLNDDGHGRSRLLLARWKHEPSNGSAPKSTHALFADPGMLAALSPLGLALPEWVGPVALIVLAGAAVFAMASGRRRVNTVDITGIVRRVVDEYRRSAAERGVTLEIRPGRGKAVLEDDPSPGISPDMVLEAVLNEVIDNAVKYSSRGGSVRIQLFSGLGADDDHVHQVIRVVDHGIGIAARDLPHITQGTGYRAPNAQRHTELGQGEGLGSSKEKIEVFLGGTLSVESPGERGGTTVTIRVPRSVSVRREIARRRLILGLQQEAIAGPPRPAAEIPKPRRTHAALPGMDWFGIFGALGVALPEWAGPVMLGLFGVLLSVMATIMSRQTPSWQPGQVVMTPEKIEGTVLRVQEESNPALAVFSPFNVTVYLHKYGKGAVTYRGPGASGLRAVPEMSSIADDRILRTLNLIEDSRLHIPTTLAPAARRRSNEFSSEAALRERVQHLLADTGISEAQQRWVLETLVEFRTDERGTWAVRRRPSAASAPTAAFAFAPIFGGLDLLGQLGLALPEWAAPVLLGVLAMLLIVPMMVRQPAATSWLIPLRDRPGLRRLVERILMNRYALWGLPREWVGQILDVLVEHAADPEAAQRAVYERVVHFATDPRWITAYAYNTHSSPSPEYLAVAPWLDDLTGEQTLVDIGANTNALGQEITSRHPGLSVIGTDLHQDQTDLHAPRLDYRQQPSPTRLPLADGEADVAILSRVLHHMSDEIRPALLQEVRRVLKPGGRVIVVEDTYSTHFPPTGEDLDRELTQEFIGGVAREGEAFGRELLAFLDWFRNVLVHEMSEMPMPSSFYAIEEWTRQFEAAGFETAHAAYLGFAQSRLRSTSQGLLVFRAPGPPVSQPLAPRMADTIMVLRHGTQRLRASISPAWFDEMMERISRLEQALATGDQAIVREAFSRLVDLQGVWVFEADERKKGGPESVRIAGEFGIIIGFLMNYIEALPALQQPPAHPERLVFGDFSDEEDIVVLWRRTRRAQPIEWHISSGFRQATIERSVASADPLKRSAFWRATSALRIISDNVLTSPRLSPEERLEAARALADRVGLMRPRAAAPASHGPQGMSAVLLGAGSFGLPEWLIPVGLALAAGWLMAKAGNGHNGSIARIQQALDRYTRQGGPQVGLEKVGYLFGVMDMRRNGWTFDEEYRIAMRRVEDRIEVRISGNVSLRRIIQVLIEHYPDLGPALRPLLHRQQKGTVIHLPVRRRPNGNHAVLFAPSAITAGLGVEPFLTFALLAMLVTTTVMMSDRLERFIGSLAELRGIGDVVKTKTAALAVREQVLELKAELEHAELPDALRWEAESAWSELGGTDEYTDQIQALYERQRRELAGQTGPEAYARRMELYEEIAGNWHGQRHDYEGMRSRLEAVQAQRLSRTSGTGAFAFLLLPGAALQGDWVGAWWTLPLLAGIALANPRVRRAALRRAREWYYRTVQQPLPDPRIILHREITFVPDQDRVMLASDDAFQSMFGNQRVVIVGPHPDDPEISMGVTEQRIARIAGHVTKVNATTGYKGLMDVTIQEWMAQRRFQGSAMDAARAIRPEEAREAARLAGIEDYHNLGLDLTLEVPYYDAAGRRISSRSRYGSFAPEDFARIEAFVREHAQTDIWMLPYPFEHSPHHRTHEQVSLAFLRLLQEQGFAGRIIFYETLEDQAYVDFDHEGVKPNILVPFDEAAVEEKQRLIRTHISQVTRKPYDEMAKHRNGAHAARERLEALYVERFMAGRLAIDAFTPPPASEEPAAGNENGSQTNAAPRAPKAAPAYRPDLLLPIIRRARSRDVAVDRIAKQFNVTRRVADRLV
ncbi:MAG: hypothetical protein COV75_03760, partial [Candidatus Omnitrophica bacterium CG11_big_fil_rev_8_21_14_0_20_63_9]